MEMVFPSERSFRFSRNVCVSKLHELNNVELRSLLPSLVRMSQCPSIDESVHWHEARKEIQKVLCGHDVVNSVVALLSVDFGCLRQDCLKEQQIQRKLDGFPGSSHSALVESVKEGLSLAFERSEPSRRLRLVLRELLRIMSKVAESKGFTSYETCELFECEVYLSNVCDVLCIAQAELPDIFPLAQMAQALLRVRNGPWFICHLLVNAPDYFEQVCSSLLISQDCKVSGPFPSHVRTEALYHLCSMNPDYALSIRSEAVQKCCLPELTIRVTLDFQGLNIGRKDLVEFLSGLLLGSDVHVRKWFAHFIKSGQKHHGSVSHNALTQLREELLRQVVALTPEIHRRRIKNEWQEERSRIFGVAQGKRKITVDEQDKETLEIIEAMDMSFDFEFVEENNHAGSSCTIDEAEASGVGKLSEDHVINATALLRLYGALKGIAGMKLTNDEADELICLITSQAPTTAAGVRFIIVGLCTVLACSFIVGSTEREKVAVKWIESLFKEESRYDASTGPNISFGEWLLLTAIHFHSNNLEAITDLVSSTLGMRVRPGALTRIKTIFTQDLFPEKAITEHAVRVAVTAQLSAVHLGFLPVHCVYHLLKNRAFTKHSVQVKDWIYNQILSSSTPLHSLLVSLIDVFVMSVVVPLPSKHRRLGASVTVEGFSEAKILAVFENQHNHSITSPNSSHLTGQLLLLYYLLMYKDCSLSNMKSLVSNNHRPAEYSHTLYSQIPIKYLLEQARKDQDNFRELYPPLLRLLVTYYPHLCLVEDWLCEEDRPGVQAHCNPNVSLKNKLTTYTVVQVLSDLLSGSTLAMLSLLKLVKLDPRLLIPYADVIVETLRRALEPRVSRRIHTLLKDLWMKLNTVIPRRLWLFTVNTLCHSTTTDGSLATPLYTEDELVKDPLTVLRCDRRIFRCPPLFSIVIRVLMGYMAASRAMLSQHILANVNGKSSSSSSSTAAATALNTEQEREELKSALLAAQESAVVQILLEVCLQSDEEKQARAGSMGKCELREIRCIVCSTLHQMFISDPKLAKLVHFQGYNPALLPVTVSGVPSMHICLNFIIELLNQPELEKQLFAVQLSSHLSVQFPLPKTLDVARYVISRLTSLAEALPGDKCASFFLHACQCLVRFCRAFPPLCMDTSSLLLTIGRISISRAAGSCDQALELSRYHKLLHELNSRTNDKHTTPEDHGFDEHGLKDLDEPKLSDVEAAAFGSSKEVVLYNTVRKTFNELIQLSVLGKFGAVNHSPK